MFSYNCPHEIFFTMSLSLNKSTPYTNRGHSKPFMAGLFKGTTLFYICEHTDVNVTHEETSTHIHTHMYMREHAPLTELRHREGAHTYYISSWRGLEVIPRTDSQGTCRPDFLYTHTPETTHVMQVKDKPLRGLDGMAARRLLDERAQGS